MLTFSHNISILYNPIQYSTLNLMMDYCTHTFSSYCHHAMMHMVPLLLSGFLGPLNPAIYGIRVASVNAFSVCLSVCSLYVTNFLILLQHNIRPPSPNCDMCAIAARVNLRRHDTSRRTVMNVMTIFL